MTETASYEGEGGFPRTSGRYQLICYAASIAAIVAFSIYAILRYHIYLRQRQADSTDSAVFVTARGTQVGQGFLTPKAPFSRSLLAEKLLNDGKKGFFHNQEAGVPAFQLQAWALPRHADARPVGWRKEGRRTKLPRAPPSTSNSPFSP